MKSPRVKPAICLNALMIESGYLSGIGNYAKILATLLVKNRPDWEISLIIHPGAINHFENIPGLNLVLVGYKSRWARWLYFCFVLPFLSRNYSLMHAVGNVGIPISISPQIITLHDVYEHVSPERNTRFKRILIDFFISISGRGAAHIITVSKNSKKDIEKYYPFLAKKLSIVHQGSKFPVIQSPNFEGRDGFLVVGTIEPGKNLPLVLIAFSNFHRLHGGRLRIVGANAWTHVELPDLDALNIRDSVEFLGFVPDSKLGDLYKKSLALIQASNYEGFGLPVIEAMACGCPVIAARNSGLIEAGGESALFFTTNDAADLLQKMETIHLESTIREKCIWSGLDNAARYTWEQTAIQTENIYSRHL